MKERIKIKGWYRYIPTCLTIGNSLCGFTAILYTLQLYDINLHNRSSSTHELQYFLSVSSWLIIGAMIFDMLDGWTARLFNARSAHGIQMDSLSDMVTFGVAPAVMVSVMADQEEILSISHQWVWILSAIYLSCVALRLATYNVKAQDINPRFLFNGLPSPAGAAAIASLVILYSHPSQIDKYIMLSQMLPFYVAVLGFLMVSPFPYLHLGKWLGNKRSNRVKLFIVILFFLLFSWQPKLSAALVIHLYVISGPLTAFIRWWRQH